jgi:hypothetical protein
MRSFKPDAFSVGGGRKECVAAGAVARARRGVVDRAFYPENSFRERPSEEPNNEI